MKKKIITIILGVISLISQSVNAAEYKEKTQYLGVVNGQVVGNSLVKMARTLGDPILYRSGETILPDSLTILNAEFSTTSRNSVYITKKQALAENREARITMKTALVIDGKKVAINARQQGDNVVISLPEVKRQVELRTDEPVELEIPASYRGNIQIVLQVED
ncbi:TPA: DUF5462 family protein [Escherichia coli]|uniref:DUF5462 family protein n=1 Tax=Escherichia coli TaxID=562 RepID=UPI0013248868|nr:DUF5462 family protein [Escherichia coli]EHW5162613.1 DUF5462 family protein [Escherichia coli]ELS6108350.1 DUF5462 family protein [Escherichia coli]MED9147613.1 DUF5462 family protein [Escherichia coli]MED9166368.1 DUF5462 family protein [Escherichia coli]MXE64295.1 fimbrial protein [Escherichia coli]